MLDRWYRANTEAAFDARVLQAINDGTLLPNEYERWYRSRGLDREPENMNTLERRLRYADLGRTYK
jgi:hypothetical protein